MVRIGADNQGFRKFRANYERPLSIGECMVVRDENKVIVYKR